MTQSQGSTEHEKGHGERSGGCSRFAMERLPIVLFTVITLAGLPLFHTGCLMLGDLAAYTEHSVNDMEKFSGGLSDAVRIGDVFETTIDLFLLTEKSGASRRFALGVPGDIPLVSGEYSAPPNVAAYYADREAWPRVINVMPKATRFEIVKIVKKGSPLWGYGYDYYGRVHIEGWPVSELASMSDLLINERREKDDRFVGVPNPDILARVGVAES